MMINKAIKNAHQEIAIIKNRQAPNPINDNTGW